MDNLFRIVPYQGVNDIKFGTSREKFHEIVGVPRRSRQTKYESIVEQYEFFSVSFKENSTLEEIEFFHTANIYYDSINLFNDTDSLAKILRLSNKIWESDETLLFQDLGLGLWGFHKEADGKTVYVFSQKALDSVMKYYKPYSP